MKYILDTNVWIAAAGRAECLTDCCNCQDFIREIVDEGGVLVVDAASFSTNPPGNSVWQEIKQNFNSQDYYFALFWEHFYNNMKMDIIELEYDSVGAILPGGIEIYQEEENGSRNLFEPNDRKWVSLHLKHSDHPAIHNATDSDWYKARYDLEQHGIVVRELCTERSL